MAGLWRTVLERMAGRRSLGWLRYLQLDRIENDRAVLHLTPGGREVASFATEDRLHPVAEELGGLLGRRVRVELEMERPERRGDAEAAPGGAADSRGSSDAPGSTGAAEGLDRRKAFNLPLVQQVLEVFPDATLIDARTEAPQEPEEPVIPGPDASELDEPEELEGDEDGD